MDMVHREQWAQISDPINTAMSSRLGNSRNSDARAARIYLAVFRFHHQNTRTPSWALVLASVPCGIGSEINGFSLKIFAPFF